MAKMQRGPIVGAISGSVGCATFAHGASSAVIRQKVTPRKVETVKSAEARTNLATVSRAWGALTPEERAAWQVYATSNPIMDRLGFKRTLAPYGAFCELNLNLVTAGLAGISVPPVVAAPDGLYVLSDLTSAAGPTAYVQALPDWRGGQEVCWVSAALISKASRVRWQEKIRLMRVFWGDYPTVILPIQDELLNRFGTLIEGQRLVFRVQMMDRRNGLMGAPQIRESVILA